MHRLTVAFCDADEVYRSRFVAYLMEHKAEEMAIYAFTEPERFLETAREQKFDVLVAGNGCEPMKKELQQAGVPILCLAEEKLGIAEGEERDAATVRPVFKYQPIDIILHEIQVLAGGNRRTFLEGVSSELEVLGVCSPVNHEMQVPFSMLLSTILSENRKVLYLNCMQFSGLLNTFGFLGEHDMGDIILWLRKEKLTAENFLRSVYDTGRFSFIPPFLNPEQLGEFSEEDFLALLEFVKKETAYETVVIDFGAGVRALAQMLKTCSSVYCLLKTGYFYEGQIKEFFCYLDKKEHGKLQEKLHRVELPFSAKGLRGGGNVLEQLLWSEFGDYMRNYLLGV